MSTGSDRVISPGRVFDGHNDVLSKLMSAGGVTAAESFLGMTDFHIDIPKAAAGIWVVGFSPCGWPPHRPASIIRK